MIRPNKIKYELDGVLYDSEEEKDNVKFRKLANKNINFQNSKLKEV